jgi:hypothetical protein
MGKRGVFFGLFMAAALSGFAQRLSTVGILPFEPANNGVSQADADSLTRQAVAELSSWGTITILEGAEAGSAEYIVRTRAARQGNMIVLTATTETRAGRVLNESKEQGPALNSISIFSFCTQVVINVPYPNYLLGTWQSTIMLPDGPVVCIIEFKSDRTVRVEKFDSFEHKQNNSLKYEGFGAGTYGYAGYVRRTITIRDAQGNSRQSPVDATISVNLLLEETLTEYAALTQSGMRVLFNDAKSAFEFVGQGLPCGRNFDGASVYPSSSAAFVQFSKIR